MNLKGTLVRIATVVAEEAARNPEFQARLETALATSKPPAVRSSAPSKLPESSTFAEHSKPSESSEPSPSRRSSEHERKDPEKRRGGRRSPALVDPVDLAAHGETELRERLASLDLERLHDVVAQYGMDPGKLVMKWRDRDRVIDRIVEVALARATKGDAFRKE